MSTCTRRATVSVAALSLIGVLTGPAEAAAQSIARAEYDLVAVTLLDDGQAILLATLGREDSGRRWRFRSFDTSALPQPLSSPMLSTSGTKLALQGPGGAALVLDLTRQLRPNAPHQFVDPGDPAVNGAPGRHAHRLPSQRFVLMRGPAAYVVDDLGAALPEASLTPATFVASATPGARSESAAIESVWRSEANLRASLQRNGASLSDDVIDALLKSLEREAAAAKAADGRPVTDWAFFQVAPDPELYVPVLEVVRDEEVFPGPFETLERLGGPRGQFEATLYERYLRQQLEARRRNCAIYFRVRSLAGSWLIEYRLYYPFDVGGISSHLHDPEHVFVEVDKLGGAVRRVIGAGHGFLAGNNIFSTDRPLARRAQLPLFVMVEFNKHATAPDMDRDGIFTPGVDENEYRERAKVWGVRDVIGTNNNHLLAYDRGMTLPRREEDFLASVNVAAHFPNERSLAARACCRLIPLPADPRLASPCREATTPCAITSVTRHPDFTRPTTILKDWVFPQSFLRATYGLGPGLGLHSVGLGYSVDLDRTPGVGRLLPLPGRLGVEAFAWRQEATAIAKDRSLTAGMEGAGAGIGVRYEHFLSNLFGIHAGVRLYSPPLSDVWITFGPMVEVPVRNSGNVNFMTGLSLSPGGSPRFEMKLGIGFWKRRSGSVGIRAEHESDRRRESNVPK